MTTTPAMKMTTRDELEDAIPEAFVAVGRACEARLRAAAALSDEEARSADTRLANLATFAALGLGEGGARATEKGKGDWPRHCGAFR